MKKKMKIGLSIIVALVLAIGVFAIVWFKGKTYKDFYAKATEEFAIPGLDSGFTPQGLASHDASFLVTGYMKDGSASRIYVVGEDTKYFTLKLNGEDYVGHAGGIATFNDYAYLVGDKQLYVFNITDALELENGKSLNILGVFDAPNGADFINIQDKKLYLGEFYHESKYPTSAKHHVTTSDGSMNHAITYVYDIMDESDIPYFVDINNPKFAISTTEKIQGMCINSNGEVVLSSSWSLADSNIYIHKSLSQIAEKQFQFSDSKTISLYILDSSNLLKTFVIPSMSEEVALSNGKVYVLFENACKKYKAVTRHKNTSVYSFNVEDVLK